MKKMKKVMALLLSLVMVLAMSVVAFADEATYTITIDDSRSGHTYEAYQIFAGDLSTNGDGSKILSNIVWGDGVTTDGKTMLGDAAAKAKDLTTSNVVDFTKLVANYLDSANKNESAPNGNNYIISNLAAGYYLVKDQDNSLTDKDDYYTAYIMQGIGNVTATPKGDKPTLDKQIKHNETNNWGVVGDNQIGDTVEFRTITTVPDTEGYTTYNYVIHDTMSTGLTSNVKTVEDVTVKVNDSATLDKKYYTVAVATENSNKFSVKVDIIQAVKDNVINKGDSLYTYYTGVLNKDAIIYDKGRQDNVAYLEYSNNPNNNNDNGKTPEKKVYDWTFKMTASKTNANGDKLTGAKFVLSKKGDLGNLQESDVTSKENDLIKLIKGENGVYTVAPSGYTEATTYVIEAGDAVINGLDDATEYYLYEVLAPTHYNKLTTPVNFKINATYNNDGSAYDKVTVTVDNGTPSGELKTNIVNQSGSTLPTTGGMGTTIFYVVGSILVLGAAILLITKKRMSAR